MGHRAAGGRGEGRHRGAAARVLKWLNKPQKRDPCIAVLSHQNEVRAVALSRTRKLKRWAEAQWRSLFIEREVPLDEAIELIR